MNEETMNYETPKPAPDTYENETIRKIVENFPVFGLTSFLYSIFFCFCIYKNAASYTSFLLCIATIGYFYLPSASWRLFPVKCGVSTLSAFACSVFPIC